MLGDGEMVETTAPCHSYVREYAEKSIGFSTAKDIFKLDMTELQSKVLGPAVATYDIVFAAGIMNEWAKYQHDTSGLRLVERPENYTEFIAMLGCKKEVIARLTPSAFVGSLLPLGCVHQSNMDQVAMEQKADYNVSVSLFFCHCIP